MNRRGLEKHCVVFTNTCFIYGIFFHIQGQKALR